MPKQTNFVTISAANGERLFYFYYFILLQYSYYEIIDSAFARSIDGAVDTLLNEDISPSTKYKRKREVEKRTECTLLPIIAYIIISGILIFSLIFIIIFILHIKCLIIQNKSNDSEEIINYIWSTNSSYSNYSDNLCYGNRDKIKSVYTPYIQTENQIDASCENGYSLGNSDYVYACIINNETSIVFTKQSKNSTLTTVHFTWEQFCTLMFLNARLSADLMHLLFTIQ